MRMAYYRHQESVTEARGGHDSNCWWHLENTLRLATVSPFYRRERLPRSNTDSCKGRTQGRTDCKYHTRQVVFMNDWNGTWLLWCSLISLDTCFSLSFGNIDYSCIYTVWFRLCTSIDIDLHIITFVQDTPMFLDTIVTCQKCHHLDFI